MFHEEILEELKITLSGIKKEEIFGLEEELQKAERIFCDGLGRSGLFCRAFAMRLMHLGMSCFYVGDTMTPAIERGDLLLICSGSGGTETLISHGKKAKKNGARIALVTGNEISHLGELADVRVLIKAPQKNEVKRGKKTVLPMGSLFEDSISLLFESLVLDLMEQRNETGQSMFQRHANLE